MHLQCSVSTHAVPPCPNPSLPGEWKHLRSGLVTVVLSCRNQFQVTDPMLPTKLTLQDASSDSESSGKAYWMRASTDLSWTLVRHKGAH